MSRPAPSRHFTCCAGFRGSRGSEAQPWLQQVFLKLKLKLLKDVFLKLKLLTVQLSNL